MGDRLRGREAIAEAANQPVVVQFETVNGVPAEIELRRPNAKEREHFVALLDTVGKDDRGPTVREVAIHALHACLGPEDRGSLAETEDLLWSSVGGASGPLAEAVMRLFGMRERKKGKDGAPDPTPFG